MKQQDVLLHESLTRYVQYRTVLGDNKSQVVQDLIVLGDEVQRLQNLQKTPVGILRVVYRVCRVTLYLSMFTVVASVWARLAYAIFQLIWGV